MRTYFLLNEEITVDNTVYELENKFNIEPKNQSFYIEKVDGNIYKFRANISLGTLIVKGFPSKVDGIKIYAELRRFENKKSKIILTTRLRIEYYLIIATFLLFLLFDFLVEKKMPWELFLIFPVMLIWFFIVYRVQEQILLKKVRNYLMTL